MKAYAFFLRRRRSKIETAAEAVNDRKPEGMRRVLNAPGMPFLCFGRNCFERYQKTYVSCDVSRNRTGAAVYYRTDSADRRDAAADALSNLLLRVFQKHHTSNW